MRQLTLTNVQFEVLHDILEDAIKELKCNLDEQTLYTTETYKIYSQLNNLHPHFNVISSDDNYADKVDTLVGNMKPHNDNEYTHDSEGC